MGIKQAGNRLASRFIAQRFGKADRVKVNKKFYKDDLMAHYLAGVGTACSVILQEHRAKPFESVDEIIGELHHIALESMNNFYKDYSRGINKLRRVTVEDMLENQCEGLF